MLNYLYGLFVCLLAMLTQGCGNHRLYVGVEQYDTVKEVRETRERGWWERIAGGYGKSKPLTED